MSKYKNKDGIELNFTGSDSTSVLVREVVSEAVKICGECDWSNVTSMRFTLRRTEDFLIENFNLENKDDR